jgi:hypothetical protein
MQRLGLSIVVEMTSELIRPLVEASRYTYPALTRLTIINWTHCCAYAAEQMSAIESED